MTGRRGRTMQQNIRQALVLLLLVLFSAQAFSEKVPVSKRHTDGEAIYRYACARCHDHGEGGAPIIGDKNGWSPRSNLWEAVLMEHADEGYLGMPAAGGDSRLTDYDVEVATEYMLERTFPERARD